MTIFKPKKGPVLQWSRVVHCLESALAVAMAGHLGGYQWSIGVGLAAIIGGFGWEVSNRWLPGKHPFGDAIDFWAFVAGALTAGVGYAVMT